MFRAMFVTLSLLIAQASQLAHAEKRIALVIGNSDYEKTNRAGELIWHLPNPQNDAQLMDTTLSRLGFNVTLGLNLSEQEMEKAFRRHALRLKAAGPDSVGVLYYAGHGIESRGANYLIPIDADMSTEQDVWAGAPSLNDVLALIAGSGNRANYIILDACRNNPLPSIGRMSRRGLAVSHIVDGDGLLTAYATAPGLKASDGRGVNSPYTRALAKVMPREGLRAEQMFKHVAQRVWRTSGGKQRPFFNSGLIGRDFYFAGRSVSRLLSIDEQEMTLFNNAAAPCDYVDFLDRYPNSILARNAQKLSQGCGD